MVAANFSSHSSSVSGYSVNVLPFSVCPYVDDANDTTLSTQLTSVRNYDVIQRMDDAIFSQHLGAAGLRALDEHFVSVEQVESSSTRNKAQLGPLVSLSALPVKMGSSLSCRCFDNPYMQLSNKT